MIGNTANFMHPSNSTCEFNGRGAEAKGEIPRCARNDKTRTPPLSFGHFPRERGKSCLTPITEITVQESSPPCVSLRSSRPPFADAKRGGVTSHPQKPNMPRSCREYSAGAAKLRHIPLIHAATCRWSGISPAWRGISPPAISPTQTPKSLRHQHPTALQQRPNLTRRQLDLLLLTIHQNPPSLQVRLELTLRSVHRVAAVVPELRFRTRTKFEGGSDLLFGHGHGVRFRLHGFRMSQQRLG